MAKPSQKFLQEAAKERLRLKKSKASPKDIKLPKKKFDFSMLHKKQ